MLKLQIATTLSLALLAANCSTEDYQVDDNMADQAAFPMVMECGEVSPIADNHLMTIENLVESEFIGAVLGDGWFIPLTEFVEIFDTKLNSEFSFHLKHRLAKLEPDVNTECTVWSTENEAFKDHYLVYCHGSSGGILSVKADDTSLQYNRSDENEVIRKSVRLHYALDSKEDSTIVKDTDHDGLIDVVQYIYHGEALDHTFSFDYDLNTVLLECNDVL